MDDRAQLVQSTLSTMATLSTADWNGDKVNKQVNATSTVVGNASDNDKSTEYVYFGI